MTTIATDLLRQHIETLVDHPAHWEKLIADDILWELVYAPSIGHPARLSGREEVLRHVAWFRGAVDRFRFFNLAIHPFEDPTQAVGEVEAEGNIKSTGRVYQQKYVVFIRAAGGKIAFIREYFDPVRAAQAMKLQIASTI
jgi:ketosteroid isomerase-like protein